MRLLALTRARFRRAAAPALALLAVAAAVVAALLAADVRAWNDTMRRDDAAFARSPAAPGWSASTVLPFRLGERLTGVAGEIALRRAVQGFLAVDGVHARLDNALDVQGARAAAENELALAAQGSDRRRASQASDLLGVLLFGDAVRGGSADPTAAEASVAAFVAAVRLDPADEAAKFNLELALRQLAAHGVRIGQGSTSGGPSTGKHGASGGTPGRGY